MPLPGRDEEGRKVIIIRATVHDPYKHKQDDVFKVCLPFTKRKSPSNFSFFFFLFILQIMNMVIEVMCRDDEAISLTGVVAVVDLAGVSMGHGLAMTPSIIRKAVNSWQVFLHFYFKNGFSVVLEIQNSMN